MLEELGLTAAQEGVYRVLVAAADATPESLAETTGLAPAEVTRCLEQLVERGLVDPHPADGSFVAAPPSVVLAAELLDRRDRLRRAEVAVAELIENYRTSSMGRAERDLLEVVEGRRAVQRRFIQLQLSAQHSIDAFVTGEVQVVGPDNTEEPTALERGVRLRGIVDGLFLRGPNGTAYLDHSLAGGAEVRTVEEIPLKLIISDGIVAMLPLQAGTGNVDPSLVLRGGLVSVAQALFEAVWQRARPYGRTHHETDPVDTRILRLLLAGLTDEAVAGQVGLSPRTVHRRIRALMDRAEVTTRIQLGWHARHHGWA
ncbi:MULTISPECIES: winged helix-turn-helix transcriptional regulator [unclassified Streptomyces]|uniref:winged helix-turn-helix transcriptional regulator n=1 Tax=unclassified Streptomyces TaxID=2593676 RepID=UPI0036EFF941